MRSRSGSNNYVCLFLWKMSFAYKCGFNAWNKSDGKKERHGIITTWNLPKTFSFQQLVHPLKRSLTLPSLFKIDETHYIKKQYNQSLNWIVVIHVHSTKNNLLLLLDVKGNEVYRKFWCIIWFMISKSKTKLIRIWQLFEFNVSYRFTI